MKYLQQQADEAVREAAQAHNVVLDFSIQSVEHVERILAGIHEKRQKREFSEQEEIRAALRWGAYIGEVIVRQRSGRWGRDDDLAGEGSMPVHWENGTSFPVTWCRKRIQNGEEDNVWLKFSILLLTPEEEWSPFKQVDEAG